MVVHYTGWLTNGQKFDTISPTQNRVDRNEPFEFIIGRGQVIRGWDEGVAGMRVGERARLTIPPAMGYGARGAGPDYCPEQAPMRAWGLAYYGAGASWASTPRIVSLIM